MSEQNVSFMTGISYCRHRHFLLSFNRRYLSALAERKISPVWQGKASSGYRTCTLPDQPTGDHLPLRSIGSQGKESARSSVVWTATSIASNIRAAKPLGCTRQYLPARGR